MSSLVLYVFQSLTTVWQAYHAYAIIFFNRYLLLMKMVAQLLVRELEGKLLIGYRIPTTVSWQGKILLMMERKAYLLLVHFQGISWSSPLFSKM